MNLPDQVNIHNFLKKPEIGLKMAEFISQKNACFFDEAMDEKS